ncbi:MAG TPA: helix-turn-helix domain-containing protein [Actinomycetes bacterium]
MSRPRGRPTETSRGKRSKDAIVQAAIRLLARRGYRGTSLAAVAAEVEMSQPGLLHHFPSKEHLLLAVLAERDREDHQRVAGTVAGGGIR